MPIKRTTSDAIPMALLKARESVMRRLRPELRKLGLTEQQMRILHALAGHESLEITELAAETCLLMPSVSRILPDLEARDLVQRQPVTSDLRRWTISLAPTGVQLVSDHAPCSEHVSNVIEQQFGVEKTQQLLTLLQELQAAMDRSS